MLKQKLKSCSFNSCLICNIKFNKRDVRAKRTLCYKPNCEYLYALKQKDLWGEKARDAKARAEAENGLEQASVFQEEEEEEEEEVMDSGVVELFTTCMFPNCCKQLKQSNITNMGQGQVELLTNYDHTSDASIGKCRNCEKDGLYPYWCIKHYKQHSMHHHKLTSTFYSSNASTLIEPAYSVLPDLGNLDDLDLNLNLDFPLF